MEEFKRCVHDDHKVFLNERQIDTAFDMATFPDEYALTHKRGKHKSSDPSERGSGTNPRMATSAGPNMRLGQTNYSHQPTSPRNNPHPPIYQQRKKWKAPSCYYCSRVNHKGLSLRVKIQPKKARRILERSMNHLCRTVSYILWMTPRRKPELKSWETLWQPNLWS